MAETASKPPCILQVIEQIVEQNLSPMNPMVVYKHNPNRLILHGLTSGSERSDRRFGISSYVCGGYNTTKGQSTQL
jgi:hypothetical protein